jgi:anti-anti-sigma regulatory factor
MSIENWSEDIVLMSLPDEAEMNEELANLLDVVCSRRDCDVVVDCSLVHHVSRSSCSRLLDLGGELRSFGHRLMLCKPPARITETLKVAGSAHLLGFADNKCVGLAKLRLSRT